MRRKYGKHRLCSAIVLAICLAMPAGEISVLAASDVIPVEEPVAVEETTLEEGAEIYSEQNNVYATGAVTLGLAGTEFMPGNVYTVPVSLKNASNITADSMAAKCLGKYALLTVDSSGNATLQLEWRKMTVGTITDYASDIQVYQGAAAAGDTTAATVVEEQTVTGLDGNPRVVPKTVSFQIPAQMLTQDGVYVQMMVSAMGSNVNGYVSIDYPSAKLSGDSSLNYTSEIGSAYVQQFGKYYVDATVTVMDGKISDLSVEGRDFGGNFESFNRQKLALAEEGMKQELVGLYHTDADEIDGADVVSGATISSRAIQEAVLSALKLEIQQETLAEPPASIAPGVYSIEISNGSDNVSHSLVETTRAQAQLKVDTAGKMTLSYTMKSGTAKEPLYVLGFNGYYSNNDITSESNLTKADATYKTETCDGYTVVTDTTIPLSKLDTYYYTNVYLYVPAMSALNGNISGVEFENGKFNARSTIIMYWDTLKKTGEVTTSTPTPTPTPVVKKNQTVTVGGCVYKVTAAGKNPTVTLSKVTKKKATVSIPATVKVNKVSCKVTAISAGAFKNNKKIKTLTISKNITSIGKNAFKGASKLKTITVKAKNIKTIGKNAFSSIAKKAVFKTSGLTKKQKTAFKKKLKASKIASTVTVK